MRRYLPAAAASVLLVLFSYWGQEYFRGNFRLQLLALLILLYILASLTLATMQWRLGRMIDESDPQEIQELAEDDPDFAELLADRDRATQVRDWNWMLNWGAGAILAVGAGPTILPWIRHGTFSVDMPIQGVDILAMFATFGLYLLLHRRAFAGYACPVCRTGTSRLAGKRPRRSCPECGRVWLLQP